MCIYVGLYTNACCFKHVIYRKSLQTMCLQYQGFVLNSFYFMTFIFYKISVWDCQVRSECLTCTFRASYCSTRLSRAQVPAFAGSSVRDRFGTCKLCSILKQFVQTSIWDNRQSERFYREPMLQSQFIQI